MGCSSDNENYLVVGDDDNNSNNNQSYKIVKIGNASYKRIKKLGKGGTCIVRKLEKDGRYFAHKKIIKRKTDNSLYKNEISILKMFDHENIVKFIESQESDDCLEIIMEFGGNSNLKKFIKKKRKNPFLISQDIISKIIIQICFGLKEIHNKKIIHRDLTPQNIFIDETDETNYKIKIGDFGISTKKNTQQKKLVKKNIYHLKC